MDSSLSPQPRPRQTQSFLRKLFRERGLRPKNKLGQNFLVDLNLVDFIVHSAELTRADLVLEVGSGTGSLTNLLAEQAGAVLSVEIDPAFFALAQDNVRERAHVQLIHGDILRNKNHLNPNVLAELQEGWRRFEPPEEMAAAGKSKRLKLAANLPFAVAVPVLANLLMTDLPFERMVVTVQWEIAERLTARPGNKDFGALSILIQSVADVEVLRHLPPTVFWPRPKVSSAIVRIWPNPSKRRAIADLPRFRIFLRDLYSHRRKNLRGGLVSMGRQWTKAEVDAKLVELGLDGADRAETLSVEEHQRMFASFDNKESNTD